MENGKKGFTLLGTVSSYANIIPQFHTRITKTAARYPARKKKNLQLQWPGIFTQGDSWMARSQLWRASQNLRAEADVCVAPDAEQMRRTFWTFFGCYWRLEHSASSSLMVSQNILTSDMTLRYKWEKCVACPRRKFADMSGVSERSRSSFSVKQPAWGQTVSVRKKGGVSLYNVNTSK